MAASFSLTSFISFISPFKSQAKAVPPPNFPLPSPKMVSQRRRNELEMAKEEPSSIASISSELASVICLSLPVSSPSLLLLPSFSGLSLLSILLSIELTVLQTVEADLSVRVASLLQTCATLSLENSQLKQQMAILKQDKLIREGE